MCRPSPSRRRTLKAALCLSIAAELRAAGLLPRGEWAALCLLDEPVIVKADP